MTRRVKEQVVDCEIMELSSKKGDGVAFFDRADQKRCRVEVPFVLPNEVVKTKLLSKRRGIYKGKLEEVIRPSQSRIEPKCLHFGECGGCRFQHATYEKQLKIKQEIVEGHFSHLITEDTVVRSIVPCDHIWHYRNKMEFSFSSDSNKTHYLGLVINASKGKVFNLQECHLPNKWFVDTLKAVKQWWDESDLDAFHAYKNIGALRTLTLREGQKTGDRMVILTVSGNPDYALKKHHIEGFIAFVRDAVLQTDPDQKLSIFLRIHQAIKGKPTNIYDMHIYGSDHIRERLSVSVNQASKPIPLTFKISPQAFFQPNSLQAEKLYSLALERAQILQTDTVYDLYCGTGVIGLCAATCAKEVVGIELSIEAVEDARMNAKKNAINNTTFYSGDVAKVLDKIEEDESHSKPDVVIVDPPRAGLDEKALSHLIKLSPQKILYISCNPKTQAENINSLVEYGYELVSLIPVDQFPHTIHIENIALLIKG